MTKKNGNSRETITTDPEEESQEQLDRIAATLSLEELASGSIVTITKQELSLLQKMLSTATEEYKEQTMWRMASFMDEDEAHDHVAAYFEAKELGMDTNYNVALMFSLCSVNRSRSFTTNLIAQLTGTLTNAKFHQPMKGRSDYGSSNPRSPLANG